MFILVDDYLKDSIKNGRFTFPDKSNQKGTYSELLTIILVGEMLQQKNQGAWFLTVKSEYKYLFPKLPSLTRFYRIQRNFERIYADLALLKSQNDDCASLGVYSIDSKPLPICKNSRSGRERSMTEAAHGYGGSDTSKMFYGFKLHSVLSPSGYICRFLIAPGNVHDARVAQSMLNGSYDDLHSIVGDKGYIGCGIYTPSRKNAKPPSFWCKSFAKARKRIEATFSSLVRSRNLMLQQLNSFWSIRASVCRKIAAQNLLLFLFG